MLLCSKEVVMTPKHHAKSREISPGNDGPGIDTGQERSGPLVNPGILNQDSILEQGTGPSHLRPAELDTSQGDADLLDQESMPELRLLQSTSLDWRRELMALAMLLEQDRFEKLIMEKGSIVSRIDSHGRFNRRLEVVVQNVVKALETDVNLQIVNEILDEFKDDELVTQACTDVFHLMQGLKNFAYIRMDFGGTPSSLPAFRLLCGQDVDQLYPFAAELRLRLNILANCLP